MYSSILIYPDDILNSRETVHESSVIIIRNNLRTIVAKFRPETSFQNSVILLQK